MPTKRTGRRGGPDRRHVGLTMPRDVKGAMLESAEVLGWSTGDWTLAAAAEQGPRLQAWLGRGDVGKRQHLDDPAFAALYLTDDEREELDELARACGLNRSAFVTAVARLALGERLSEVVTRLREGGG